MNWQERLIDLKKNGLTWEVIAKTLSAEYSEEFTHDRVRGWFRRHRGGLKIEENQPVMPKETIEYLKDGTRVYNRIIELVHGDDAAPEEIIKAHGLDPDKWTVLSCRNNFWNAQLKGGTRVVMYQSRLTVKPKSDGLSLQEIDEHFARMVREYVPPACLFPERSGKRPCMAEVNIADLHLGKLAWHGDVGEDYDHKIARRQFDGIVDTVCAELSDKNLEYILFVWANDFFNSDTISNTTTAGTPQSVDMRWQKLFNVGVEMLVSAIDRLASIAPVKTFYLASNHDEQTSYHANKFLEAWYRKDPRVEVNIDAQPRKYVLYGNTLIGFCHGCDIKPKQLSGLMPIEARDQWGKAKYCEMHTAHLHSEHAIEELNGIIVRRISSPTGTDTWHNKSGFIGQVRKAQSFIYDRENGLEHIINTPVL